MKRRAVVLASFLLAGLPTGLVAAAELKDKLPEKPLTAPLARDLLLAARGAARLGVQYLKAVQEKHDRAIWFPPDTSVTRIRTGWRTVQVTHPVYKTVTRMVPIQKVVGYKWVWLTERNPKDPYAPVGRRRVREPIYKVVGRRPQKVSARDGKKTRVVEEKRPVYMESDRVDLFTRWTEGLNALALYTLLQSGEPPGSPAVTRPAEWLHEGTFELHSIPDTTYEISLFVMCFCQLDKEKYGAFVNRLLEKLLRGQIEAGECRGQWGIYSVDIERLKALQIKEMKGVILRDKYAQELAKCKQELARAATKRAKGRATAKVEARQKVVDRLMGELKKIRAKIVATSRDFTRGEHWSRVRRSERVGGDIRFFPGAFYDARFTRRGDMANTHLALIALRDAVRHGYLKSDSALGKRLTAAVARAANALKKLQQPDGSWGYGVHEHRARPPSPPKKPKKATRVQENPNLPCLTMTAAGLASLDAICGIAGRSRVRASFGDTIDKARTAALKHLRAYSKRDIKLDLPICTQYTVLYYSFVLATALDDPGLDRTRFGLIPEGVLCRILFAQENDGSWPRLPLWSFGSSKYMRSRLHWNWRHNKYEARLDHKLINTCFAILFLCEIGRPEIGGWNWRGQRDAALERQLADIRGKLTEGSKTRLRRRSIPPELPDGLAGCVPALAVAQGKNTKERLAAVREKLGKYLAEGGLVIVQSRANAAGTMFEEHVKDELRAACKDVAFRPLPEAHAAFNYFLQLGKAPHVNAAWHGERLLAVFLTQRAAGAKGLSEGDVKDVTRNLLAAAVDTKALKPTSVIGPETWIEVEHDIEAALNRVKEEKLEEPQPELEPKEKPKQEPEKPKKEPEKPKKPDTPKKTPPKEKTIDELIEDIHKEPEPKPKKDRPKEDEKF